MKAPEQKLYQDQLYGAKVLSSLAVAIIDTPEFQRLAGLKQLGFADLCYRGARHTRFEHSVGAHFVARTVMRRIVQNHERLDLEHHPGDFVSPSFRLMPKNSQVSASTTTPQSLWRGVTEVVCAAALLHDLGHVPFGHTLEDEFVGLLQKHDSLGGPRLHTMLFDARSELAQVFSDEYERWLPEISNQELGRLIYVILNWKEQVEDPPRTFDALLEKEIADIPKSDARTEEERVEKELRRERLQKLRGWHESFTRQKVFHPFMSDVVGNTICADILDYLPRDRMNLGMDSRQHTRLQRYFTIRPGTFHGPSEGLRLSIMVTRRGHGGQRRDVATAVLEVMRERYEMAERVFYHHKKAAASAMLAKLLEIVPRALWPRDDKGIYPAPWRDDEELPVSKDPPTPHLAHLSDARLIDYLGSAECENENKILQRRLVTGLLYRRTGKRSGLYRTLLVVDSVLAENKYSSSFSIQELRGANGAGRIALENGLAKAGKAQSGEVIIYCPPPDMQAKEIDVRLEIEPDSVRPLRELADREQFTDFQDVDALRKHYKQLWRTYVFVSPELFGDKARCQAVVNEFCEHYGISPEEAYKKARTHKFGIVGEDAGAGTSPSTVTADKPSAAPKHGVVSPEDSAQRKQLQPKRVEGSLRSLREFQRRESLSEDEVSKLLSAWMTKETEPSSNGAATVLVGERPGSMTVDDWEFFYKQYLQPGLKK